MHPHEFYKTQIAETTLLLARVKRRSLLISMLRLVVFLVLVWLVYVLRNTDAALAIMLIAGAALFLVLVSVNTNLKHRRSYYEALLKLNKDEADALAGNFAAFHPGTEYADGQHAFSEDMDLFGRGSVFQSINRAATKSGEALLAALLKSNDIRHITEKQEVIRELSSKVVWRHDFRVNAKLIHQPANIQQIADWMKSYKKRLPAFLYLFSLLFAFLSVAVIVLSSFGVFDWEIVLLPFFCGLLVSGLFFAKVSKIASEAGHLSNTFRRYSLVLCAIENESFTAPWLIKKQDEIKHDSQKASEVFAILARDLNNLDQRNNVFFALVANGFLLWDLRFATKIEKWITTHTGMVETCFESISFFDAYGSFANYAFNNPDHVFPGISGDQAIQVKATELGHPLLNKEKRITNDFEMHSNRFLIITGANMAGKSTFLRTVGTAIVFANCGLPVCAASFSYNPIKLISSMRSSDSLQKDESYFFAELKRLKYIVDQLDADRYFVILDEILKGTNSKDKEEGSKKFVRRLVSSGSIGIIATHDLTLCQLESEFPQVRNHYFDAEIINNDLHFDYKFKNGICHNMNASFLLKKMGIVE